jgi:hypothetical protein
MPLEMITIRVDTSSFVVDTNYQSLINAGLDVDELTRRFSLRFVVVHNVVCLS